MICPLFRAGLLTDPKIDEEFLGNEIMSRCQKLNCAWWNSLHEKCAISQISHSLENLMIVTEGRFSPNA